VAKVGTSKVGSTISQQAAVSKPIKKKRKKKKDTVQSIGLDMTWISTFHSLLIM
jgi:hypothetical protein